MRLKTILLAIFILQFTTGLISMPTDTSKTLIYIIGVNHSGNKVRNADSLLILLRDIRPDLILWETDTISGYFRKDYSQVRPPWWYKAARQLGLARQLAPEDEVVYSYLKDAPTASVYPFDIAIPDRSRHVKKYIGDEQAWLDAFQEAYNKGQIPADLETTYQSLLHVYETYAKTFEGSYRQLNRRELTDSLRVCLQREEELSKILVDSVLALAKYKEWQARHYADWKNRNEAMAKNLIRFTEKAKARKVVVFTGLMHKYYLIDKLGTEHYRQRYELVEYYENP